MPATLTAPTSISVPVLHHLAISVDLESGNLVFSAEQSDGTNPVGPALRGQMTWAAFITAFQAASGTPKQKTYTVVLGQLGLTASAIT